MSLVFIVALLAVACLAWFRFHIDAQWQVAKFAQTFHRVRAICQLKRILKNEHCPAWLNGFSDLFGLEGYDVFGVAAVALVLATIASLLFGDLGFGLFSLLWNAPLGYFLWMLFFET